MLYEYLINKPSSDAQFIFSCVRKTFYLIPWKFGLFDPYIGAMFGGSVTKASTAEK